MRDRLVELIKSSLIRHIDKSCKLAENIADDLLADGVIVPPAKVGQKIYVMESENTGYYECEIVSMQYDGVQWLGYMNCLWVHHHGGFWKWQECDIGKTVFLTREEAERVFAEATHEQH